MYESVESEFYELLLLLLLVLLLLFELLLLFIVDAEKVERDFFEGYEMDTLRSVDDSEKTCDAAEWRNDSYGSTLIGIVSSSGESTLSGWA